MVKNNNNYYYYYYYVLTEMVVFHSLIRRVLVKLECFSKISCRTKFLTPEFNDSDVPSQNTYQVFKHTQ